MKPTDYKKIAEEASLKLYEKMLAEDKKKSDRANKNFPKVLKKVYQAIDKAAHEGRTSTSFNDGSLLCFWRWNHDMRILIAEELESRGFVCSTTYFNGLFNEDQGALYISWK